LRLDGKTPNAQRQNIVDQFNDKSNDFFVFLLSSKAGGVGFNLVGSNRMVLYDPDWNPANDSQAMGRIWRYGQRKSSWIYRLVSTGTIEEKILQRQMAKEGLFNAVVDANRMTKDSMKMRFTKEDLRDIFSYNEHTLCDTHELFGCHCVDQAAGRSRKSHLKVLNQEEQNIAQQEMATWQHCPDASLFKDTLLQSLEAISEKITFVFQKQTKDLLLGESAIQIAGKTSAGDSLKSKQDPPGDEVEEDVADDLFIKEEGEGEQIEAMLEDLLEEL